MDLQDSINVYIRPGAEHSMLNFYIPAALKSAFIAAVSNGSLELPSASINFEMAVLPQWIADEDKQEIAERSGEPVPVRIPLQGMNFHFTEE